jgi:hypothetical protein
MTPVGVSERCIAFVENERLLGFHLDLGPPPGRPRLIPARERGGG